MSTPIAQFSGAALYLDTTAFYALLRALEPAAKDLFDRIEHGDYRAYTSVLTFDELSYRLLLALIRDRYPGSPLDQLRQQEEKLIATLYPHLAPTLDQLRHFPNLLWLDVTAADLAGMSQAMLNYHVRPRDALHLTAMQKCGCFDVVSQDADFDRIPVLRRYVF